MNSEGPRREKHPPAWADSVLRALLPSRSQDTVTGDLLEEYIEVVLPSRGVLRANLWYLRQVASFATARSVFRLLTHLTKEEVMFERLWRVTLVCGLLVAAVLLTRLLFDRFDPVDPVERFLAQARDDYSEFNYPRRWMPAVAVAAILLGGGLFAAWRTGRIAMGTMAAGIASSAGTIVYVCLAVLANVLSTSSQDPLGDPSATLRYFGNVPTGLVPMLALLGLILGTMGGVFGWALRAAKIARSHG